MPLEETTPLLNATPVKRTPLPWGQFSILLFLQLAEPLTAQVIYPFSPQLVREIGITNGDETKVGFYVGLLESIFFIGQAITTLHWSRLSDYVGRKPVILIGSFGLALSMWSFGLSKTFWGLLASRCLSGALNGNLGVIKSMMTEITDPTNIAQAFAYFPLSWCVGTTVGPLIGGYLSHPSEEYPAIFGKIKFLKSYPYFLACSVPASFSALSGFVILFWLRESVKHPTPLSHFLCFRSKRRNNFREDSTVSVSDSEDKPLPIRAILTKRVIIAAGNYSFLALIDIVLRAVQPVFLSTPVAFGGLDLQPSQIGPLLSMQGIFTAFLLIFCFPKIIHAWGPKKTFLAGIASALPAFALFPILSILVRNHGMSWLLIVLVILQAFLPIGLTLSYGAVFMYIAAASPNRASIGATNGLSQMTVSVFRALGPAAANSLYSISLAKGYMGGFMVYYILMGLTCFAFWLGSLLPNKT